MRFLGAISGLPDYYRLAPGVVDVKRDAGAHLIGAGRRQRLESGDDTTRAYRQRASRPKVVSAGDNSSPGRDGCATRRLAAAAEAEAAPRLISGSVKTNKRPSRA